jgi:S-adenosylmethionine:tRNA-ribosyltransferase-isomerase (queuine synthetase)
MTLVTALTSLLTRLKYSAHLTKFIQEITSSLSNVTNEAGHMITLDTDIDRATRERDAKRYQYIVASEREFNR